MLLVDWCMWFYRTYDPWNYFAWLLHLPCPRQVQFLENLTLEGKKKDGCHCKSGNIQTHIWNVCTLITMISHELRQYLRVLNTVFLGMVQSVRLFRAPVGFLERVQIKIRLQPCIKQQYWNMQSCVVVRFHDFNQVGGSYNGVPWVFCYVCISEVYLRRHIMFDSACL